MKLLTILIACVAMVGCGEQEVMVKRRPISSDGGEWVKEIKIDSCEYIVYIGETIVHKGNCNNPIHKTNNPCNQ